jgi:hypothetical protein
MIHLWTQITKQIVELAKRCTIRAQLREPKPRRQRLQPNTSPQALRFKAPQSPTMTYARRKKADTASWRRSSRTTASKRKRSSATILILQRQRLSRLSSTDKAKVIDKSKRSKECMPTQLQEAMTSRRVSQMTRLLEATEENNRAERCR